MSQSPSLAIIKNLSFFSKGKQLTSGILMTPYFSGFSVFKNFLSFF